METKIETCQHTSPVAFGSSQVIWTDRQNGVGTLIADCSQCGVLLTWEVVAD